VQHILKLRGPLEARRIVRFRDMMSQDCQSHIYFISFCSPACHIPSPSSFVFR
jgi:hypothetical protein